MVRWGLKKHFLVFSVLLYLPNFLFYLHLIFFLSLQNHITGSFPDMPYFSRFPAIPCYMICPYTTPLHLEIPLIACCVLIQSLPISPRRWTPLSPIRPSVCLSWPPFLRNSSLEIFAFLFCVCFRVGFVFYSSLIPWYLAQCIINIYWITK